MREGSNELRMTSDAELGSDLRSSVAMCVNRVAHFVFKYMIFIMIFCERESARKNRERERELRRKEEKSK